LIIDAAWCRLPLFSPLMFSMMPISCHAAFITFHWYYWYFRHYCHLTLLPLLIIDWLCHAFAAISIAFAIIDYAIIDISTPHFAD
jgi:hypothetical protein